MLVTKDNKRLFLVLKHVQLLCPATVAVHREGPTRSRALPLMNIPRTKNSQQRELETPYGQDLDGFGGVFMILKAAVRSNFA